ncbi:MAG: DUF4350 domain-containing protein [Rubrivivax sp.]|nr:MAG: DUF4350 domain-containing protein [Rubrivivax sp.]
MTSDRLLKIFLGALLLAVAAWVAMNTEWVDKEVRTPPKGEALTNEFYSVQQVLRQLGAKVVRPEGLNGLPPQSATLFLDSWHWDLFPEREKLLRAWVQRGGHLVIEAGMLDNERLQTWLPVQLNDEEYDDNQPDDKPLAKRPPPPDCESVTEPAGVAPAYADGRTFKLCGGHGHDSLRIKQAPQWAIQSRSGLNIVRLAVGQGSVTVFTTTRLLRNQQVLQGDNALLAAALLQVRRGREVWFVAEEARPPLLEWVWTQGWVAVVLGLLALGAALWRGAVRFGPLQAKAVLGRRSMAEQVKGTAQFLRQQGADALHAAQVRALDETARKHLRDHARLGRQAKAQAIAHATGLDAETLARALDRKLKRSNRDLPDTLAVLETARRRLSQPRASRHRAPAPSSESR